MGILGIDFHKKKTSHRNSVFCLTPLGDKKAEAFDLPQNKWKVLNALKGNPSSIDDVASETGMEEDKVYAIIKELGPALVRERSDGSLE